ncbi:Zn-ribbon domain-containing OB-fold protein [Pseudorhodoferax sp.]|uniref:Zn-ribbon domain-containing OB-fold protein n=1 Tax=Pseudorhodoferax sp. TaxID=1993553 RepID=UPI002DD6578F|nr:Zn-ribbon domain-containing OB-fold protein [Pseudorhodoferax sp.]
MNEPSLQSDPYAAAFPELLPFWEATARGVLLLPRCRACGQVHWHPRAQCPECRSDDLAWTESKGSGTLHTFTVVRRPGENTLLAYVRLDEGPLLMTNIVGAQADALRIGMPVQVDFRATAEGRVAPVFRPA